MSDDTRQELGRAGEALAAEHLSRLGFQILERNYRTRRGELDVVAFDGETLVFCEVKSRRGRGHGTALEAVHPHKRRQVRQIGRSWLADRPGRPFARCIRFDAIGLTFDAAGALLELRHVESAF